MQELFAIIFFPIYLYFTTQILYYIVADSYGWFFRNYIGWKFSFLGGRFRILLITWVAVSTQNITQKTKMRQQLVVNHYRKMDVLAGNRTPN